MPSPFCTLFHLFHPHFDIYTNMDSFPESISFNRVVFPFQSVSMKICQWFLDVEHFKDALRDFASNHNLILPS